MKTRLPIAAAMLLSTVSAWAQHDDSGIPLTTEAEIEALCRDLAKEDRISAAEMDEYMKDCIASQAGESVVGDVESAPADK
jgi:hypothetical protein